MIKYIKKPNLIASIGKWLATVLLFAVVLTSCNKRLHRHATESMLVIEQYNVIEEVPQWKNSRSCMVNYSFSAGHINSKRIDSVDYWIFITSSFDSLIVCPISLDHEVKSLHFPEPLARLTGVVRQLYYHNHDSVFVMFDRVTVLNSRQRVENFSDIYLLNGEGIIINQYNLDSVPHIYTGRNDLHLDLTHNSIRENFVSKGLLYLPFGMAYELHHDTLVRNQPISTIASVDLTTKRVKMLNIPPPLDLLEKNLAETGGGYSVWISLLNDSTLLYHFPSSPSVYLYDLNTDTPITVFSYPGKLFSNDRGITQGNQKVRFEIPRYIPELDIYFRKILVRDYKDYEPFEVAQFFDKDFNETGYYFKDTLVWLFFHINLRNQLFVSYKGAESMMRVMPGEAKPHTMEYIEQNLLVPKPPPPFDETLKELSYEERVALYLTNFDLPDDSRVVMYSMRGACSHILSFLMESYRMNHEQFGERNVRYLFYDRNIESTMRTIELYDLENTAYIVADTNRLFLRYFHPAEYGRNPLVRYRNAEDVEVMTYNPQTLYEKYGYLMRKSED